MQILIEILIGILLNLWFNLERNDIFLSEYIVYLFVYLGF